MKYLSLLLAMGLETSLQKKNASVKILLQTKFSEDIANMAPTWDLG
jgi:hypothetical protein